MCVCVCVCVCVSALRTQCAPASQPAIQPANTKLERPILPLGLRHSSVWFHRFYRQHARRHTHTPTHTHTHPPPPTPPPTHTPSHTPTVRSAWPLLRWNASTARSRTEVSVPAPSAHRRGRCSMVYVEK